MSQETTIGNLSGGISDEDSRLVDSILNDLNGPPQQQQQQQQQAPQQQGPGPTPEQQKMMMAQRQQQMAQQQMAQQQMAQQQMAQQQMAQKPNVINGGGVDGLLENIKTESKSILVIIVLAFVFNLDQVDTLLKAQSLFVSENGSLNMQAILVKALVIGILYYVIKTQVL
jgi:hypothetical protein